MSKTRDRFSSGDPSSNGGNFSTDIITPPTDGHHVRVQAVRKQLQRLEGDLAGIKSLVEEREKAVSGIRWEVEVQGGNMEEVEERSARTMRELRRLRKMAAR